MVSKYIFVSRYTTILVEREIFMIITTAIIILLNLFSTCFAQDNSYKVTTENGIRKVSNFNPDQNIGNFTLKLERTFGGMGIENEEQAFSYPSDMAEDSKGNIYILDRGNSRVQVFDNDGKFLRSMFREGQGPEEISSSAISIDINNDDELYLAQWTNKSIKIFTSSGRYKSQIKPKINIESIRILNDNTFIMPLQTGNYMRYSTLR